MIIYKTTNLINNKIYIGQDSNNNPKYFGSGILITRSIRKYGKKNFVKEILEYCNSQNELNKREIYWIAFFNSTNIEIGYNIANGGLGPGLGMEPWNKGKHLYEETKEKISKANKGRRFSKEVNDKKGRKGELNSFYGKKHSDESRKKMSENHADISGDKNPMVKLKKNPIKYNEWKNKAGKGMRGKKITPEQKEKRSKILSGEGNPMYGKKHSDDTKQKISKANKGRKMDDLSKKHISDGSVSKVKVQQYTLNNNFVAEYNCIREAAKANNIKCTNGISYCCRGKRSHCGGYIWKYCNEA